MPGTVLRTSRVLTHLVPSTTLLAGALIIAEERRLTGEVASEKPSQENYKKWEIVQTVLSQVFEVFLLRFWVSLLRSLVFLLI